MPVECTRKLIRMGKNGLVVTVPRAWANYWKLQPGQKVTVIANDNLTISPRTQDKEDDIEGSSVERTTTNKSHNQHPARVDFIGGKRGMAPLVGADDCRSQARGGEVTMVNSSEWLRANKRNQCLVCGKMIGVSYYSSKNQNAIIPCKSDKTY